jgi:hypothetical protein
LIWNHWGSKPHDSDGKYTSGFEEEYERAKDRVSKKLMKNILLFFKSIPDVQVDDQGPSVKKVIKFREKCIARGKPLFKDFRSQLDFEPLVRAALESIGWREAKISRADTYDADESVRSPTNSEGRPDSFVQDLGLIGGSSARFFNELLQRSSEWDAVTPFEVARLRLIAASVNRSGNDELYLGNHDANLLFAKRNDIDFSDQEVRALVDTGVYGFDDQNVPLWHWLGRSSQPLAGFERIRLLAIVGEPDERANAIRILLRVGERTPSIESVFDRKAVVTSWLLRDRTKREIDAALEFLATNGDTHDLSILREIFDDVPPDRKDRVASTIVAMLATSRIADAFEELVTFDPDPIGENAVERLFSHPESIHTDTLKSCLMLKSNVIRRRCAKILLDRDEVDTRIAESLMTDGDPEVRLVAVESLVRLGKAPQEDTIKKALVQPESRGLLAFGGGDGGYENTAYYERYQANQLTKLSYGNLLERVKEASVYEELEVSVLYKRFTRKHLTEIRRNLKDGFKGYFEEKFKLFASTPGMTEKLLSGTRRLERFIRQRLTSNALDAVCAYGKSTELALVRKTIDEHEIDFSVPAIRFLARFGNWSDRDRILSFVEKYSHSDRNFSMFPLRQVGRAGHIAAALYAIGRHRLVDLLALELDTAVRRYLILQLSQSDLKRMSDEVMIAELSDEDDRFRKVFALRCVDSLTQARLRNLLDAYIAQDGHRYYNSIHWLDLGASMSRSAAKSVSKFELASFKE